MNYGHKYMNAHWTGKRVILGSGDAAFLDDFDKAVDVIAHEITHGVILRTSGLANFGEPGALSEHLADVFGLLYKHYEFYPGDNATECTWTIGESLWSPPDGFFDKYAIGIDPNLSRKFWLAAGGKIADNHSRHDPTKSTDVTPEQALTFKKLPRYLRSFSDPTSTMPAQPIHIDDYANLKTDNGGVHHNSGIGNYVFYIAAMDAGGSPLKGVGQIWFRAMIDESLGEKCGFSRFAAFTVAYATRDFGHLVDSVKRGWDIVGVEPDEVQSIHPRVVVRVRRAL
ncbi:uncharacterized protein B0J16DRAFT_343302 [Fusarium flagelliforme]|uniref:uncharacterized protein n=1 Tax=Fusarium flagelliforme TaxID=2675880 RepID=UPI001E8CEA50|nr:uncharacterized protein B0J16DRAFT_343302 [Fusarium flagelliforme]KAH7186157.1 hypothetical protein B0J16DRAFT_343302 [Fusarium flagelliforme]